MKTSISTYIICITVFVLFSQTSQAENINPLPTEAVKEYQVCAEDSDCVVAQNGCCDCANGGEDVAINKNKKVNFLAQFSCEAIMCTQLARIPGCGKEEVECAQGLCKLK